MLVSYTYKNNLGDVIKVIEKDIPQEAAEKFLLLGWELVSIKPVEETVEPEFESTEPKRYTQPPKRGQHFKA